MRILALEIYGFRGIGEAKLRLPVQVALVGPPRSGKSTLVDALSLVLGRQRLVRDLTEHDFTGSTPVPRDRIRLVATLGGFSSNDPDQYPQWFRKDRAVVKWWDARASAVRSRRSTKAPELCVQIGFAARFDLESLEVEQIRYFHDDDEFDDPFMEDAVRKCPYRLLQEVGFFVLPARRTWPATLSFGSELFRKVVTTLGGVPAERILALRDELRQPSVPLEQDPQIRQLVTDINAKMAELLPGSPSFQLRVTGTDSESVLRALVPHYQTKDGPSLPAARHGSGLVSLQSLILLLELGRARKDAGESFILAMEEPELHVPPGLQRRLIGEATSVSEQVLVTTHAPRVAAFFDARSIQLLSRTRAPSSEEGGVQERLEGRPLAPASVSMSQEPNSLSQLYTDDRSRLVEALMFPRVLVPEGRSDYEWLRLLLDIVETGVKPTQQLLESPAPPYGAVVGVVPTRNSAVKVTFERLRSLHDDVLALVDGDDTGNKITEDLLGCSPPPFAIVQWPDGWSMEDVVGRVLAADEKSVLPAIDARLKRSVRRLDDLIRDLKNEDGRTGGLKAHYIVHEEIAGAMRQSKKCVQRAGVVLDALSRAALSAATGDHLEREPDRSTAGTSVYRLKV